MSNSTILIIWCTLEYVTGGMHDKSKLFLQQSHGEVGPSECLDDASISTSEGAFNVSGRRNLSGSHLDKNQNPTPLSC